MDRRTKEQVAEVTRLLYAIARGETTGFVQMPSWMDTMDLIAFSDMLPYVKADVERQRYGLQADGIYLTSNSLA